MFSILYITYDGLTDPLGQSQILPYLKRLSEDFKIVIVSYEKRVQFEQHEVSIRTQVDQTSITWVPLKYTKKPPILSSYRDIEKGYRECKKLHLQYNFQLVHCRGYLPSIIGRRLKRHYGTKFIFDMRGWWPDEKKESGSWNRFIYRRVYAYFKRLEKKFFSDADFVVSLTHRGKEEIMKQEFAESARIGVIPTCVDFDIFKPPDESVRKGVRQKLEISEGEKVFSYSGSVNGNYDLNILIKVFKEYMGIHVESYLLILSKDEFDENIVHQFKSAGINRFRILSVPFTEVTNYLRASDVGFIQYKLSFSTIGRSPTKLGEYWASGIPAIALNGIGDLDKIFNEYSGSGVLLSQHEMNWKNELDELKPASPQQLRLYAKDYFHIDKGVAFYKKLYETLMPVIKNEN